MQEKGSILAKMFSLFLIIVTIICLYNLYNLYKQNYFNDFIKAEHITGKSSFIREKVESNQYSYKITSSDYNDAIFYKTIEVSPNTAYKISCMVKTQAVETRKRYFKFWSMYFYIRYNRNV